MEKEKNRVDDQEQREKEEQRKRVWDIRPYLAIGATAVLVVLVCIIIFFVIFRFGELVAGIGKIGKILQAVIIGAVLAYILNPVMTFFERNIQKSLGKRISDEKKIKKLSRGIAILDAELIMIGVIVALLSLIIPQLIINIEQLVLTLPGQIQDAMDAMEKFSRGDSPQAAIVQQIITNGSAYLEDWMQNTLLHQAQDMMTYVTSGVMGVIKVIFNFIVGIIISVYILGKKETFICQIKKLIYTIFPPKKGNHIMEVLRKSDDIFGGFFLGEIIDAIIVGLLCFAILYIGRFPYALLVSVIVGVTNIIPFFGPFIGAIPGALLIFLQNPIYALYFLIVIVVIQQIDGNVIKPKVLGDSTGLSPFWVIFSILLFGGIFGFAGMLFGVPVFSIIYYLIKRISEHFLNKRKLPARTRDYLDFEYMDVQSGSPVFYEEDRQTRHRKKTEASGGFLRTIVKKWREKDKGEDDE